VLAGVELMHMIRKGQFVIDGAAIMSLANQFYALAQQVRPA
jgi:putative transposase